MSVGALIGSARIDRERASLLLMGTVQSHLPVNHVCHVATIADELHCITFLPECQLRPSGLCFRVLLKPSNPVPVKVEIHLLSQCCSILKRFIGNRVRP